MTEQRKRKLKRENQSRYRKKQKTKHRSGVNLLERQQQYANVWRHELGRMDQICIYCNAKFWINEKDQNSSLAFPSFAVCCAGGKINLSPLLKPPSYLLYLYTSSNSDATTFRKNIRGYNNLLAYTSFGANISKEFQGQGLKVYLIFESMDKSIIANGAEHETLLKC